MLLRCAVVCVALLALVAATDVTQCPEKTAKIDYKVELIPCKKLPCRLKKGTDQHIKIIFTPDKDMTDVKNIVTADLFGIPVPFVGVDHTTICEKLTTESGDKVSCPLKAGTTYVYLDSFPILSFYPKVELVVRWALANGDDEFVCFKVPARIS